MQVLNSLLIDSYDSARHCDVAEWNHHALQLKKLVSFESAALVDVAIKPDRKKAIQAQFLHQTPIERFQDRMEAMGQESVDENGKLISSDTILATAFRRRGESVVADVTEYNSGPRTLSYCRKYGTAHSLAFISDKTFGHVIPALALWRACKKDAYQPLHSHRAMLVIPHLIQARGINRQIRLGPAGASSPSAAILTSLEGQLYFIDSEAIRLLQLEWPEWSPLSIPGAMIAALRQSSERGCST